MCHVSVAVYYFTVPMLFQCVEVKEAELLGDSSAGGMGICWK